MAYIFRILFLIDFHVSAVKHFGVQALRNC